MDDQLGAGDEVQELARHVSELGLRAQVLERQPMHARRAEVDVALRIQIAVELALAQAPREDLDTADFDDAIAELGVESRGFGVKDDLARHCC